MLNAGGYVPPAILVKFVVYHYDPAYYGNNFTYQNRITAKPPEIKQ
jgi:hypothetical protein